jgi:MYXO-CTERM domain-containing protein
MSPSARSLLAVGIVTLSLAAGVANAAAPIGYAAGFDTLFRIDIATRQGVVVGEFGQFGGAPISDVEGLAFAADGTLYGVSDSIPGGALVRINTSTGRGTVVGNLGLQGQGTGGIDSLDFGLAATCDGRMWVSSDTIDRLWEVDTTNGSTRLVGNTGAHISGLAARADGLFGIGVEGDEGLYRIDTDTGAATLVRKFQGVTLPDAGLDFDADGNLWAVFDLFPPVANSDLVRIDPETGVETVVGRITGPLLEGGSNSRELEALAIAPPVCEPDGNGAEPALPVPAASGFNTTLLALALLALGAFATRRFVRR